MKTKFKKIGKAGGITIPSEIRREYGFSHGNAVDIDIQYNGQIVIKKHTPQCIFCGAVELVGKYFGRDVCKKCVTVMVKEVGTYDE